MTKYYAINLKYLDQPQDVYYPLPDPYIFEVKEDECVAEVLHNIMEATNDGIEGRIIVTDIRPATEQEVEDYYLW